MSNKGIKFDFSITVPPGTIGRIFGFTGSSRDDSRDKPIRSRKRQIIKNTETEEEAVLIKIITYLLEIGVPSVVCNKFRNDQFGGLTQEMIELFVSKYFENKFSHLDPVPADQVAAFRNYQLCYFDQKMESKYNHIIHYIREAIIKSAEFFIIDPAEESPVSEPSASEFPVSGNSSGAGSSDFDSILNGFRTVMNQIKPGDQGMNQAFDTFQAILTGVNQISQKSSALESSTVESEKAPVLSESDDSEDEAEISELTDILNAEDPQSKY
jgi:hypothetical protein